MGAIEIDNEGVIRLPEDIASGLKGGTLELVSGSPGHLFLSQPAESSAVLMSGILEAEGVADLLSFFNMFRRTGILTFELDGGSKSLYFQQGEIVYATSSFAKEDLGEVLFSLGKVERETLHQARRRAGGHTTLGKVLVDLGGVSPKDLWMAARIQVENIVYALFGETRGGFYFQSRAIEQEQILRLSMSTQNLIMEGLRRQDEAALFMRKILSLDFFPKATELEAVDLTQVEARLFGFIQPGNLPAKDLFRKAGLPEFEGLRVLYELISRNLVRMEETPATEVDGPLGEILGIYNTLFRSLYRKLAERDHLPPGGLERSLRELPQPYSYVLRDVRFLADGALDGQKIVANLEGLEEGDREKLLADSLCEVAYIETMMLRKEMAADEARPLIAKVHEVTTKVRKLVGRR